MEDGSLPEKNPFQLRKLVNKNFSPFEFENYLLKLCLEMAKTKNAEYKSQKREAETCPKEASSVLQCHIREFELGQEDWSLGLGTLE